MNSKIALMTFIAGGVIFGTPSSFAKMASSSEKSTSLKPLTELEVLKKFKESSLSMKREEVQKSQVDLNQSLLDENFQARLKSNYNFKRTDEQATNRFQPVISPAEDWSAGIEKRIPLGLQVGAFVFGNQSTSDGNFRDATQMGGRIQLHVDLWKNIGGRLDRAQLSSLDLQKQRAAIQYAINSKKREVEVRKVFWSLVATEQSLEYSKQLLESAEKQLNEAIKRQASGVADRGEVARYRAQVDSRQASLLLFEYERELLLQFFEREFDGFHSNEWQVDLVVARSTEPLVGQCLRRIEKQNQFDSNATLYDEAIELLKKESSEEVKAVRLHDDPQLQLVGQYQTTGVAQTYRDAQIDQAREKRDGYGVGLQLMVPLGKSASTSAKHLETFKKSLLESQSDNLDRELHSQHETMIKALALLQKGLQAQEANAQNLEINLKEVNRKFAQGRVPVTTVILEQDSLFQSNLQKISIQKQIAHLALDYFSIFNEFPCAWNQLERSAQ